MAKRAMTEEAKTIKARAILDKAEELFLEMDYSNIKMTDIAKEMGMSNGILFVYFKTKETLFFSLLCREYERRISRLTLMVEKLRITTYDDFKKLIIDELSDLIENHHLYIRLESIRSAILEKNVEPQMMLKLKINLYEKMENLATLICENKVLTPGEVADILQTQSSIIVGCNLSATIPAEISSIIEENNLVDFRRDFKADVIKTMKCYLNGYKIND